MRIKKVKYLGVCAATLLTVSPIATSVASLAVQSVEVKADTTDPKCQKSLNEGFGNNVQVSVDQLQDLGDYGVNAEFASNGTFSYYNVRDASKNRNHYLFSQSGLSDKNLRNSLDDDLFRVLSNPNAKIGALANADYKTVVSLKGDKVQGATNSKELVKKLKALVDGDSFFVNISVLNSAGSVVGTRDVNVKVLNRSNLKVQKLNPIYVKPETKTTLNIDADDYQAKILDSAGNPAFTANTVLVNGLRYGVSGATHYVSYFDMPTYELKAGEKSTTYSQLIKVVYDRRITQRYSNENFVFLKSDNSGDVDPAGADAKNPNVYVVQPVIVTSDGKPVEAPVEIAAPSVTAFPETLNVNSKTTKSVDPLNGVKATYVGKDGKAQDITKANIKVTAKDAKNVDVKLNADGTLPTTTVGTYTLTYVFSNPDDLSKTTTRTLTVNVSDKDVALTAPTVKGFVEGKYTLSNVNRKSINPFDAIIKTNKIDASYIDKDGKVVAINNNQIKVSVVDANNKAVVLNSDGTIPMEMAGTYKITYTFSNGDDASKKVEKTVDLTVNEVVTSMPVAKYYDGMTQDFEDTVEGGPFIKPLNGLLLFSYTYTTPENKEPVTKVLEYDEVKVEVTKDGKPVQLDSEGEFATEIGVYKIKYTVVNPLDNSLVLEHIRTATIKEDVAKITNETGVVYINYIPGYGVNLWKNYNTKDGSEKLADGTDRKLMDGTSWKYDQIATNSDGTWYRLGTNQWVQGRYADKFDSLSWEITEVSGVGTVNYVPGYGVLLWKSPYLRSAITTLPHGSSWKYYKIAKKYGNVVYNLGGDQWVDGTYFK